MCSSSFYFRDILYRPQSAPCLPFHTVHGRQKTGYLIKFPDTNVIGLLEARQNLINDDKFGLTFSYTLPVIQNEIA
jgi:hypothetical protein